MYRVNEVFETIQGEGSFTGCPAIFIRLQGCPVGCAWCDTKQTWHTDDTYLVELEEINEKQADSEFFSLCDAAQLLALVRAKKYTAKHGI